MIDIIHTLFIRSKQIIRSSVIPFAVILVIRGVLHIAFFDYLTMASMILIGVLGCIHGFTGFLITLNEYKRCEKTNYEEDESKPGGELR